MTTKLTVSVVAFAIFGAVLAHPAFTAPAGAQSREGVTRTIFASVLAKDGSPITDVSPAEFSVREGGKLQSIASAKIATMPLRVHIIVSDGGSGAFQLGVLRLMQALVGRAEFALTSVLGQSQRIMNFTGNRELIGDGIQQIGQEWGGRQGTHQVMESISAALTDIAAHGKHAVLIVLRIGNEEPIVRCRRRRCEKHSTESGATICKSCRALEHRGLLQPIAVPAGRTKPRGGRWTMRNGRTRH